MPTLSPLELSRQLRFGQSDDLTHRRCIVGLSLVTVAAGQIVTPGLGGRYLASAGPAPSHF